VEFSAPAIKTPTVGIRACACAVIGQTAAAVPSPPMNSRRRISLLLIKGGATDALRALLQ
jgi:hypothetical protein